MARYKLEEFEGYTHRFIVDFKFDGGWRDDKKIHIYSDSDSKEELGKFIAANKSDKTKSFEIVHRASKEEDNEISLFIEEFLRDLTS
jgi:hypothetical protein